MAFDGFPIFDPRPVVALAKELYPEQGEAFFEQFRTRLFFQPRQELPAAPFFGLRQQDRVTIKAQTRVLSFNQPHDLPRDAQRHASPDDNPAVLSCEVFAKPTLLFYREGHRLPFGHTTRDSERDTAIDPRDSQRHAPGTCVFTQFQHNLGITRKSSYAHGPLDEISAVKPLTPVRCYGSWPELSI